MAGSDWHSYGFLKREPRDNCSASSAREAPVHSASAQSAVLKRFACFCHYEKCPAAIALTTAALLVLETRVKFKRDHTGKWCLEVEKKSAGDSAPKLLAQRLLSFLNG